MLSFPSTIRVCHLLKFLSSSCCISSSSPSQFHINHKCVPVHCSCSALSVSSLLFFCNLYGVLCAVVFIYPYLCIFLTTCLDLPYVPIAYPFTINCPFRGVSVRSHFFSQSDEPDLWMMLCFSVNIYYVSLILSYLLF